MQLTHIANLHVPIENICRTTLTAGLRHRPAVVTGEPLDNYRSGLVIGIIFL